MKKKIAIGILAIISLICFMTACETSNTPTEGTKITLTFFIEGQTNSTTETEGNQSVTLPSNPTKEGYNFDGWYLDDGTWNKKFTENLLVNEPKTESLNIYAHFTPKTYSITYETEGGTHANLDSYTIESSITLTDATKSGYNFLGWYNGEEAVTDIKVGSMGDLILTAKWTANTYTINYILGDARATQTNATEYTIETDIITLTNASLNGYEFDGWYTTNSFSTKVTTVAGGEIGDKTIYAKFTVNSYDLFIDGLATANYEVSFNLNGANGTVASQTITSTNALRYPSIPSRENFLFGGWFDNQECAGIQFDFTASVTRDIELFAKWIDVSGQNTIFN